MKKQGRQHGMVQTYFPSPGRPQRRCINKYDSPSTAGLITKVSTKPSNHSKYTGKCGWPRSKSCHDHPVNKSMGKTKGTHKLKDQCLVSNCRLVTWRVVDRLELNFSGLSATELLDHLDSDYYMDHDQ